VAVNPDNVVIPKGQHGGAGFKFDRLGPRVPAIVISAYTPAQTRLHSVFEHTSILKTVVNCFGLPDDKLGRRQIKALDVGDGLPLDTPRKDRAPISKPHFSIRDVIGAELHSIIHSKFLGSKQNPITDLQRVALHGAALFAGAPDLHDRIANIDNELEADLLRAEQEAKLVKNKIGRDAP
jgi:hypothetical protein